MKFPNASYFEQMAAISEGQDRRRATDRLLIRKSGTEPLIRVMSESCVAEEGGCRGSQGNLVEVSNSNNQSLSGLIS